MTLLGNTFAAQERQAIMASLDVSIELRRRIADQLNAAGDGDTALAKEFADAVRGVEADYERYESGLPRVAISRCPFSGGVVSMAMDTFGLDGPWWNSQVPARPVEDLARTVFAVTGAVAFGTQVPITPFVCKPGPGAPYVVPRLLVYPEIKAVVSSLRIGAMQAYAILYFSEDPPLDVYRVNTWGLDRYRATTAFGEGYSAQIFESEIDFDYDLEFYVRTGRLLWIAPGDEGLMLRSVVTDCPYIGLEGRRYPVGILDGKMWNCMSLAIDQPQLSARSTA
jgi:hypothetical protein